jgi:hypothetical protein
MSYKEYTVGYTIGGYYMSTPPFSSVHEARMAFTTLIKENPDVYYEIYEKVYRVMSSKHTYNTTENHDEAHHAPEQPQDDPWGPPADNWATGPDAETTYAEIENAENCFDGMTVEQYGRGYLLIPDEDHSAFGTKYYRGGWWMPSQNAWFFKENYYEFLCSHGATATALADIANDYSSSNSTLDDISAITEADDTGDENGDVEEDTTEMFVGMSLETYGKGYLLIPPNDHPDFGVKYYHDGWWIPSQGGWFFKSENYDYLVDNCATDENALGEDLPYTGMTVSKHGRGYLLTPPSDHPNCGEKYYGDGWWIAKHNAWFFKSKHHQSLLDGGALGEDLPYTGMTVSKHGRGYLLNPPSDHPDCGEKYYGDGWWIAKSNAWFFKSKHYQSLLDAGALIDC